MLIGRQPKRIPFGCLRFGCTRRRLTLLIAGRVLFGGAEKLQLVSKIPISI
jgi:hypothetical protein